MKIIEILLPVGYFNIAITTDNKIVGDSNNSEFFYRFSFPLSLPKFKWKIFKEDGLNLTLVDKP